MPRVHFNHTGTAGVKTELKYIFNIESILISRYHQFIDMIIVAGAHFSLGIENNADNENYMFFLHLSRILNI